MSIQKERDPFLILRSDLREAAQTLTPSEIRYFVDLYYQLQENRKRAGNQYLALSKSGEPNQVFQWTLMLMEEMEKTIKKLLDEVTNYDPMGKWAKAVIGVGPIISAGLLAHINMDKVSTAGSIWRFAGLDPTQTWNKHEKRPWNADLKVLCWKIGESFVKVSGNPKSLYGKLWSERKAKEIEANDRGEYADQAKKILETKKIGKDTEAYKHYSKDRLPPGQIHARAKRWAVKIFLAHWFEQAYRLKYGKEPPLPYVVEHLGHVHQIEAEVSQERR